MVDFSSIKVGDYSEITREITQEDIDKFVDLTGDDNKLHVDSEFAKKTAFKKPVVHGMLGASFISTIIGTKLPGDGALWYSQSLEFLLPVRIGDNLRVCATVLKKRTKDRSLVLSTEIFNQNKQLVLKGRAEVKVPKIVKELDSDKKEKIERVALVLGGTGGIGSSTCLELSKLGFKVVIHYNKNRKMAEKINNNISLMNFQSKILQADITSDNKIEEMVAKVIRWFGRIDVIVNCAYSNISYKKFDILEWEDYEKEWNINIKSFFKIIKSSVPHMQKQKYGKIIGITTQATEQLPPQFSHYITAKAALEGLLRSLAVELAPSGILVNLVSPGMTDTDFVSNIPEKARLVSAARTPLRRIAKPEDVANAICFLASDKSDYLSGETIRVNGGQVMR